MSGPNTDYDPVEVTPLHPAEVRRMREAAVRAIAAAKNLDELKQARLDHVGDRSPLALANREIGALPPQARKDAGRRVGSARRDVSAALDTRTAELEAAQEASLLAEERVDVTLPYDREPTGARHPITTITERICDIFVAMGWSVADGPEVEVEWMNFDALNFAPDHPARTMQDTMFLEPQAAGVVLRTHTSPVQIRSLLAGDLPVFTICPGRVYRTDELDPSHAPVFHQVEGLAVAEGITMGHLKGTLDHFAAQVFGAGVTTRFRPSFFPFTEPSAEVDLLCFVCRALEPEMRTCRTCSGEGWLEWGGCGVVNPRVLRAADVDPDRFAGFAFGMGIERTLMVRHGVEDMRDIVEGDVRFALPFGLEL